MTQYVGSCHCGTIKYSFNADITQVVECNCSLCRRRGFLWHFTLPDQVALTLPEGAYTTYLFNKHTVKHYFCNTCGCAPFSAGKAPSGADAVAINLRCLDEALDLSDIKRIAFDGDAI
ncbi:MAG: GFA family protein [Formosimonas sp.]|jgi:hypothetical protein